MKRILITIISLPLIVLSAEWQSLDAPHAGRAIDMSIGQDGPTWVIYAANKDYKIYSSTNDGASWQVPTLETQVDKATCVITRPTGAQYVYIGKYENSSPPEVVWRSTNSGENWHNRSGTSPDNIENTWPLCFAMHPTNSDIIYAGFDATGGSECFYKTTNEGANWTECGIGYSVRDIFVDPGDPDNLYIATNNSVYMSTDAGASWEQIAPPPNGSDVYSVALNSSNVLFAGVTVYGYEETYSKIFKRSVSIWVEVYSLGPIYPYVPTVNKIVIDNSDESYMYATFWPFGFHKSDDYGNYGSWEEKNSGIVDKYLFSLIQHPSSGYLFVGGDIACLYKSTDCGENWTETVEGMKLADVRSLAVLNNIVYGVTYTPYEGSLYDGVTMGTSGGQDWQWLNLCDHFAGYCGGSYIEIAPSNTEYVYEAFGAAGNGFITRTTDGGKAWILKVDCGSYLVNDLTVGRTNHNIVRASTECFGALSPPLVLRTTNGWDSWTWAEFPSPGYLRTVETDPLNLDVVYAGGWWQLPPTEANRGPYLKKSTDGGVNWNNAVTGMRGSVKEIAIDPINTQNLYAVSDSGPFRTTNAGELWTRKKIGLSEYYGTDIIIDPEEPSIIYALTQQDALSTTNSFYCTVDGAAEWFQFTLPPSQDPPSYIHEITIDDSQADQIYAGTQNGIYLFYPDYKIKNLTSSANKATSVNSAKKMLLGGLNIWITYESGGVIYAVHSSDEGYTWSRKMEIGHGYNPAISSNPDAETPIPGIVWWAPGDKDTLYFAKHVSGYNWTTPFEIKVSADGCDFGPPSFVIGTDNKGRVVYQTTSDGKINYTEFDITNPNPIDPEEVGDGINPSIGFMIPGSSNPEIHVVWEDNNKIRYKSRTISGTWDNYYTVCTNNSKDPSIEVEGSNVYVVWEKRADIHYRYAVYTQNGQHTWSKLDDFATDDPSSYPVLTGGNAVSWVEYVNSTTYEIYFSYNSGSGWVDPINISQNTEYSHYPHIVHKQTLLGTIVYFTWTENDNPPYDVRFDNYTFGGSNPEADLAFYIAEGGEPKASPFNLHRDGYLQYGPEFHKKIDYDSEYLEYQFEKLNPAREYALAAYAYQEGNNNLPITIKIDNVTIGGINLPPETLIVCKEMVPENLYADSAVDVKIFGNKAVTAALVLYEYERESDKGGGGPQDAGATPFNIDKLTLSISPNPVRKDVNIRYTLPQSTKVTLSVYDVAGRLARTLVNSTQKPGSYQQSFNTANLSQGVYFVRLHTGDKSIVEKVIFLK